MAQVLCALWAGYILKLPQKVARSVIGGLQIASFSLVWLTFLLALGLVEVLDVLRRHQVLNLLRKVDLSTLVLLSSKYLLCSWTAFIFTAPLCTQLKPCHKLLLSPSRILGKYPCTQVAPAQFIAAMPLNSVDKLVHDALIHVILVGLCADVGVAFVASVGA